MYKVKNVAQQGPVLFREEASGVEGALVHGFKKPNEVSDPSSQTPKGAGTLVFSRTVELEEAFPISVIVKPFGDSEPFENLRKARLYPQKKMDMYKFG